MRQRTKKALFAMHFEEARGNGTVRFSIADAGQLQYTVNGQRRPPFKHMHFEEQGMVRFPEIEKTAVLPAERCAVLTMQLQRLAVLAGIGVEFEEARGNGTLCFTMAGDGQLQYSVNGLRRAPFKEMVYEGSQRLLRFPEIGTSAKVPAERYAAQVRRLLRLSAGEAEVEWNVLVGDKDVLQQEAVQGEPVQQEVPAGSNEPVQQEVPASSNDEAMPQEIREVHLSDDDPSYECAICLDCEANATLVHIAASTAHQCCCIDCATLLKERGEDCPVCRLPIDVVCRAF